MKCAWLNEIAEIVCGALRNSGSKFLNVLLSEQLLMCRHDSKIATLTWKIFVLPISIPQTGPLATDIKLNNIHSKAFSAVCFVNHVIYSSYVLLSDLWCVKMWTSVVL
jgi:hypothetical protein